MAQVLSRTLTVYSVSADYLNVKALSADDIKEGSFTAGGSALRFSDGREPILGIAVTRESLNAVIEAMKGPGDTSRPFHF
jgi:hypothetical protein